MNRDLHRKWEARHRDAQPSAPASSLLEVLPILPRGRALDVAAGDGANAVALARAGCDVVAIDFSAAAMRPLAAYARQHALSISPLLADLEAGLPLTPGSFDIVLNIRYLERALLPALKDALRPGGMLLFDTFLIDQAAFGHPSNPLFMLDHYELRDLLSDMDLLRYREGLAVDSDDKREWRAMALARKRQSASGAPTGAERTKPAAGVRSARGCARN